ncbi:MAG TPA: serine/threonine protein kinase, partial [Clostridia bacterium]|nr:serine/threonine protein kinase [Clostridia bacterium]
MQSKHDKIRDLFLQALELATPEERAAFLSSACGADAHLRAEVERMLSIRTQAGDFFEPFENQDAQADKTVQLFPHIKASSGPLEECGSIIGRYKLLEQIGEGGFGVVYMAEQLEPVRRRVALKIIKLGM